MMTGVFRGPVLLYSGYETDDEDDETCQHADRQQDPSLPQPVGARYHSDERRKGSALSVTTKRACGIATDT